tara:strand:- start:476 stop:610 length:135 start_codon:yes stop_codon:yes gene_type:complete
MADDKEDIKEFQEWLEECPTDWWTISQEADDVRVMAFYIGENNA